jgi:predicted alpha/beta-fold hydrolase
LAFRGTNGADLYNWVANFKITQTMYPLDKEAEVHKGFFKAYELLKDEVRTAIDELYSWFPDAKFFVTGYSLGGSLALLAALDLQNIYNLTS